MKITINVSPVVLQSYLTHYNESNNTSYSLEDERVLEAFSAGLAAMAEEEIEMRGDDHSGFATEELFTLA